MDPDNRRPVDWVQRATALAAVRSGAAATPQTMKLSLIVRALALRARRPKAFDERCTYEPLVAGPGVCAFKRGEEVAALVGVREWEGAVVEGLDGRWRDVLAEVDHVLGGEAPLKDLAGEHGLALLERR